MMKRIIILITLFSLLNSCYYIEQAILEAEMSSKIDKGPEPKIETWDLKRDELKKSR